MTEIEYLNKILSNQNLTADEVNALVAKRKEVQEHLETSFDGIKKTIRWAGSKAKDTMVRDNYDADIVFYVSAGEEGAGSTLDEIYQTVLNVLAEKYTVETKTSAIRLRNPSDLSYSHVDVVPGRFFDDTKTDTWLHRTSGDKCRFKTNLDIHIETIRDSGLRPLIRLFKYWAMRNGIVCSTFVLELLVIELGAEVKSKSLVDQVVHVLSCFRDKSASLAVEDPANPTGNDLSEKLNEMRYLLQFHAIQSLKSIGDEDWVAVFGDAQSEEEKIAALKSVSVHVKERSEPWCEL